MEGKVLTLYTVMILKVIMEMILYILLNAEDCTLLFGISSTSFLDINE